jgi:glutamyl-tRNA synthetase
MMATALRGPVRVRFAPSPTGFLHVGGARTAIYNDLLRQSLGGALILRIEDTDKARSDEAMTREIQAALAWVGVEWDEGPYLQSARVDRHRGRAAELVDQGRAYRCFCPPAELERLRREAEKRGEAFRYPRTCLELSSAEVERRAAAGEPWAVRFRFPPGRIAFTDLVRGAVEFPAEQFDDFILLRSDGSPTYHMSVVVDDIDMAVSHVIRGEDHLTNTPKHVRLFEAFAAPVPAFGHLPLILGPDRKRLSKRTGATSVEEFRAQGILPQALYNYLALLGWSPGEDRELMTRHEMVALFTAERLNASPAIFDPERLAWMNGQYLSRLEVGELEPHLRPFLRAAGLDGADPERLRAAIALHRSRARALPDLVDMVAPYFAATVRYEPAAEKYRGDREVVTALRERWAALPDWGKEALEASLRGLAEERGVKAGALIHPARMALTGVSVGPPLFDVVELMARERALAHLDAFVEHLGQPAPAESPER